METVIDWSKKPEGATHYAPAGDDRAFRWFNMDKGQFGASWIYGRWDLFDRPSNRDDMVEIKAPWTGEGLPPVGIEIEAMMRRSMHDGYAWQRAKVVHGPLPGSEGEVLVFCLETTSPAWVDEFRPVRTPEQIAAEERKAEILGMIDTFGTDTSIWGRDAVMEICVHLWESGYRKQVAP